MKLETVFYSMQRWQLSFSVPFVQNKKGKCNFRKFLNNKMSGNNDVLYICTGCLKNKQQQQNLTQIPTTTKPHPNTNNNNKTTPKYHCIIVLNHISLLFVLFCLNMFVQRSEICWCLRFIKIKYYYYYQQQQQQQQNHTQIPTTTTKPHPNTTTNNKKEKYKQNNNSSITQLKVWLIFSNV